MKMQTGWLGWIRVFALSTVFMALCHAGSARADLVFLKLDTATPGMTGLARFSGGSLSGTYATAANSTDVFQYNAANRTWQALSSYATHRDDNSLGGNGRSIAVSGDYIYVSRADNPGRISIYNGTSWSTLDLSHTFSNPLTRSTDGIYAQDGKAVIGRNSGYINIVENGVDTITSNHPQPVANTFYNAGGVVGVGDTVFVKGTNNQISRSTDLGETWSDPVTISSSSSAFGGLHALDADTVFSAGYNNAIWRSTNGGHKLVFDKLDGLWHHPSCLCRGRGHPLCGRSRWTVFLGQCRCDLDQSERRAYGLHQSGNPRHSCGGGSHLFLRDQRRHVEYVSCDPRAGDADAAGFRHGGHDARPPSVCEVGLRMARISGHGGVALREPCPAIGVCLWVATIR